MDDSMHDRPLPSNTGRLISGLYASLQPFQWVRELLTNAKDADASRIHFGLADIHGVHKRYALDDGHGMVSHEILDLGLDPGDAPNMAELFGLGFSSEEEEHFGVGAKASLLNWNAYGLLYLSGTAFPPALLSRAQRGWPSRLADPSSAQCPQRTDGALAQSSVYRRPPVGTETL